MNIYHSESDLDQYYQNLGSAEESSAATAKPGWLTGSVGFIGAGCLSALCLVVGLVFYRQIR